MSEQATDRGARRRAACRAVLGRPGSLVRWFVFTGVWLVVCLLIFVQVEMMLRIVVLVFALLVPLAAFRARSMLVGDEDELNAAVKREVAAARSAPTGDDLEDSQPPETWLSRSGRDFHDVPPPPSSESE